MRKAAAVVLCLVLLTSQLVWAQTADVPTDHWAYAAVRNLADKGFVNGYPDGKFLGNRTLSRYEMATIINRVLENIESKIGEVSAKNPSTATVTPSTPAVSAEDLASVKKLVDEYKVELTVIGADLKKVQDELDSVKNDVQFIKDAINEPEGAVQTTISDVAKLKKIKVSGYVQGRYEVYQTPAGVINTGNNATLDNRLYLRRARFKITGEPTHNTNGVVQLDLSGYQRNIVETKDAYLEYHPWGRDLGPSVRLGQMNWPFGYIIERSSSQRETPERPKAWAGTSVGLPRYPSFNGLFPGERDRGVGLFSPASSKLEYAFGAFNGTGTKNQVYLTNGGKFEDDNVNKAFVGRVRYPILENLLIGGSAYSGQLTGVLTPTSTAGTNVTQTRFGGDLQYYGKNFSLKGEYMTAREPFYKSQSVTTANTTTGAVSTSNFTQVNGLYRNVIGWYVVGTANVTKNDQIVAMYDVLNDNAFKTANAFLGTTQFGTLGTWNLGVIHYLDDNTKLKLFYEINNEQFNQVRNNGIRVEMLTMF